jgi:hypothetical protein
VRGLALLLAVLLVSGCLSTGPAPDAVGGTDPDADDGSTFPTLACTPTRALQGLSSNLAVLDFLDDGGMREELDTATVANRTILAASYNQADAMEFYDITDPLHPEKVADWQSGDDNNDDFKFLPDGTGIIIVGGSTLRLLDVRDLSNIAVESTFELDNAPAGVFERGHTIQAWTVDGITYASMGKAEGRDVSIFRVEGAPGDRTLTRVASLSVSPLLVPHGIEPLQAHDTWFEVDPDSGTPMLWVANVDWGVVGYDVTDPEQPVVLSTLAPGPTDPLVGYSHSVAVAHVDGRRLVVSAQEYESGVLKVYDATDLGAPRLAGTFHDEQMSSFHNMQVVGPYVLATHFAQGLFIFDLREVPTPNGLAQPIDMPVFAHADAEGDVSDLQAQVPVNRQRAYVGTYEVTVRDGVLWTIEVGTGVRSFAFGCMQPGDSLATSTG